MSEQDRTFEEFFWYAVYIGLVIDRAWDEREFWGENTAEVWDSAPIRHRHAPAHLSSAN
jgi:hypothetical protein